MAHSARVRTIALVLALLVPTQAWADPLRERAIAAQIALDAAERDLSEKAGTLARAQAVKAVSLKALASLAKRTVVSETLKAKPGHPAFYCGSEGDCQLGELAKVGYGPADLSKKEELAKFDEFITSVGMAHKEWSDEKVPKAEDAMRAAVFCVQSAADAEQASGKDLVKSCKVHLAKAKGALSGFKDALADEGSATLDSDAARVTRDRRKLALDQANGDFLVASTSSQNVTFSDRMRSVRELRCLTAFCFGGTDGTEFAVEPVLDLPISMYWSIGEGGMARYINATDLQLKLNAGVRFWFAKDMMSLGLLLAEPQLTQTGTFHIDGSAEAFGPQAINRPFPTIMFGFFADVVGLTVSYDQVRNTNGSGPVDSNFRDNEVLSRSVTFGVSINTFTALRNAFGAVKAKPADKGGEP